MFSSVRIFGFRHALEQALPAASLALSTRVPPFMQDKTVDPTGRSYPSLKGKVSFSDTKAGEAKNLGQIPASISPTRASRQNEDVLEDERREALLHAELFG